MANELKMAIVESIFQLRALRWSARRIARHLGIDRGTVRKYLTQGLSGPKPAIPPAGSDGSKPATNPPAPGGSSLITVVPIMRPRRRLQYPPFRPPDPASEEGDLLRGQRAGRGGQFRCAGQAGPTQRMRAF